MTSSKKNFSIQAFRQKSDFDEASAKKLWNTLRVAINEIYNQNASSLSFEELYRNAYNLVLHRHSELLYGGVRDTIKEQLVKSRDQICSTKNDELMQSMVRTWTFHTVAFNMMKDILMYMDKSYAITRKKAVVYTLALQLFRSVIIYDDTVRERLRTTLLQEILRERLGHVIDRSVLKAMLGMLQDLNIDGVHVYEEEFERYFLEDTVQFYRVESLEFLSRNTCQDYVAKAETRLREEDSRVHHYLSVSTEPKLRTSLEAELIAAHTLSLLSMEHSGFTSMLRDDKLADLAKIYALFSRVPSSLEQMRDCLGRVVKGMGQDIIAQQQTHKDPVQFVKCILELKEKFDVIIQQAFRAEKLMVKRLNGAFEAFINEGYHCASHLANYVDELLRGGAGIQVANELEIEDKLERVLVIFKFIADKDIFENYYRRLLSRRLLSGKTVSDELEKQMIAKLKAECGYQFTSKLEGMYLDMKISKSVQENFQSSAMYPSIGVAMDVHVLTMGYWPIEQSSGGDHQPPQLQRCNTQFNAFYAGINSGRKLSWITHLGSVDMRASFSGGRKELTVSVHQASILLLFNNSETLSMESIRHATGIPDIDLRRHLLSLCTPKLRILKKKSKGKGLELNDEISFNQEFTSKFKRFKVPLISLKEVLSPEELANRSLLNQKDLDCDGQLMGSSSSATGESGVPESVEEERRHVIEAALMRIMKSRKRLSHHDLIAETTRQLSTRFTPTPAFIKKRVESLIEREFLERDKDDNRVYLYIA